MLVVVALPSFAQVLISEGFETQGFVARDGGFTSFDDSDPLSVFRWTDDAGVVVGAQALEVRRTVASGTGSASSDGMFAEFFSSSRTLTAQLWVRMTASSATWGAWPVQLHGLNNPSGTNAEIIILGNPMPQLIVRTDGRQGGRSCTPVSALPDSEWHLLELVVTGNGTTTGNARGYIDGAFFCESQNDWSGYPATRVLTGTTAFDREWVGSMVLDELLLVEGQRGDRIDLPVIALTGTEGDCVDFPVDVGGIDDAGVLDPPAVLRAVVETNAGGDVSLDPQGCQGWDGGGLPLTRSLSGPTIFGLTLRRAGSLVMTVDAPGLLGGGDVSVFINPRDAGVPDAGSIDAGSLDAGSADAGPVDAGEVDAGVDGGSSIDAGSIASDAGTPDSGAFLVGCGCQSSSGLSAIGFVLLITRRRRSSGDEPRRGVTSRVT